MHPILGEFHAKHQNFFGMPLFSQERAQHNIGGRILSIQAYYGIFERTHFYLLCSYMPLVDTILEICYDILVTAYYNEIDPFAAAWLRNLIAAGHIPLGEVDERSIEDVTPRDLRGYTQCHFFAGIGGWPYALRKAGWPDDRPVWTGSCPCQPFSNAGSQTGFADKRHLWPSWFWLIEQSKPGIIFGEQVEAAIRQHWLDLVSTDLEGIGYTFGAVVFPACGVGAPHIRQRVYFVADSRIPQSRGLSDCGREEVAALGSGDKISGLADTELSGTARFREHSRTNGFWRDAEWLWCRDEKYRPVESGTFPLAHGAPNRVGRLRGYGNAIVAPQAQAFIKAYLEASSQSELCEFD